MLRPSLLPSFANNAKSGDEARLAVEEIDMVRGRTLLSGYGTLFMEGVEKCC